MTDQTFDFTADAASRPADDENAITSIPATQPPADLVRAEFVEEWVNELQDEALEDAQRILIRAEKVRRCWSLASDKEREIIQKRVAKQFGGESNLSKYKKIAEAKHVSDDLKILPRGFSQIYSLSKLDFETYNKAKAAGMVHINATREELDNWAKENDEKQKAKVKPPLGSFKFNKSLGDRKLTVDLIFDIDNDPKNTMRKIDSMQTKIRALLKKKLTEDA